jgi:predicted Zn-dependent protease
MSSVSSRSYDTAPKSFASRLASGRPVMTRDDVETLAKRVLDMTSGAVASARITHTACVSTRLANGQVLSSDDGDVLELVIGTEFLSGSAVVLTNQLDDSVLRALVRRCEALARAGVGPAEKITPEAKMAQDAMVPVKLWHETTIQGMTTSRGTVIPDMLNAVTRSQLKGAGFVGLMARAEASISKDGLSYYSEETDSEVTVTARTPDGRGSGWAGQAARDWSRIRASDVAERAIEFAKLSAAPQALEPGRRTAILTPTAVVQLMRYMVEEYGALMTDIGGTGFSKRPSGNKLRQRVFDPRISMRSDPADPDGGYRPYMTISQGTFATPAMSWVENGVLKNLAYDVSYALDKGKPYAEVPYSIRVSGGPTSIEEMIANCKEGVYVNRFSDVEMIDRKTGLMTGVTRDGCFFIKNGKIDRAVKNFRILESPFFFLNKIVALGPPERAAFGYTPPAEREGGQMTEWPRRPIIVPPMMVRDFNFNALADAV